MRSILIAGLLVLSGAVNASLSPYVNATVDRVIQWESDGHIMYTLSSGVNCYSTSTEKNLYSLMLSLYATKNLADIHCYAAVETINGFEARKVHRVIAK